MKVTFKLYASLGDYLPAATRQGNIAEIDVAEGISIAALIEPYKLPHKLVHLVLVNGVYVAPEDRFTRVLQDGDVLAIWPPIAGG